ncbi:MAG TPA: PSD1 and planctomycete cytochrome C domain-containing protein [Blastocatellia bacterium]|nr:PSD1 and planctomycete cytochrome C domain-containing protein [Blastocatellia bacterium]
MVKNLKTFVILLSIAAACQFVITSGVASEQSASRLTIDFARDVRPIFEQNCFGCHGAERAMSQLRLDVKRLAMKGGQSGAVVILGDSKASLLMRRVLGLGGEQQMPLGKEPLKPEQIEILRRWIDEGAVWPEGESGKTGEREIELPKHWAYVKPVRPQLPSVKDSKWVRNPIDRFILSRLEKEGLRPSPEADKSTLIRRLSLDLTGLPPTLEEIDDFLADASPRAYENLVERLLASPQYGERWGRWWLDAARYADTNGFEKDRDRSIWPYRDCVINAFNADKPFDQFMIEQIAGDLLPDATLDQRIATGFLRNSMLNEEGAVDPEQFRVEGLIDRVDAIGKAFLGMTLNCAQCHDHKFDPIKHDEYYRFYAFLNQDEEPEIEVPTEAEKKKRAGILAGVAKIEDELLAKKPDLPQSMAEWELKAREDQVDWTVLENADVIGTNGVKFEELLDRSFIPRGDNPPTVVYYIKAKTDLKNITGFRLELLTDHTLPRGGPGRSTLGMALLSEFTVEAAPAAQPDKWKRLTISGATADYAADNSIRLAIDGNPKTSWSIDAGPGLRNQERRAVFTPQSPVAGYDGGVLLKFSLEQKEFGGGAAERFEAPNIGRFRISLTTAPQPKADPLPPNARRILSIPAGQRTAEQRREVFRYYRTTVPEFAEANKVATDLMRRWPYAATTLVVTPRPVPRETRVFKRGDWKRPGEAVTPGTPSFLHPFPSDAPRNRLGLARWIVDKNNPLTARVIVNRVWQQYFGQGLVVSPEDFGMRCETPSHPELLDWLAAEFRDGAIDRDSQWSLKRIHKLIVMSATYRQSSTIKPESLQADPTNRLLARAPRLRVEAEVVRDIALRASGLLRLKIGGPSVYPPIPDGAMAVSFRSRSVWETSKGEDKYRRGMYTFWKRSVPYPSMSVFDAPNADMSCTRRTRSNSPLQALTTLNDAAFMEAAQSLALRVWKEGGADERAKMIYGFRLCTGRRPDEYELNRLLALLRKQRERFAGDTAAAVYVSSPDLNNLPSGVDLHKLAPWTIVARVLLNLDETITRQ